MNQETPNFENLKNNYNSLLLPNLIDNPVETVQDPYRSVIRNVYEKIGFYFSEDAFRHTLTIQRRNNIESNISATLDQLQQITSYLSSNPSQLRVNIENIYNNIQSYLEEIELRFWTPYQVYLLQGDQNLSDTIEGIKKGAREVQAAADSSEETLRAAGLLVSLSAEAEVANYFQRTVNGLDTAENDKLLKKKGNFNPDTLFKVLLILSALTLLSAQFVTSLISAFDTSNLQHYFYLAAFVLALAAYPMKKFFEWLVITRPAGYERSASLWFIGAFLSVVGTGIYAAVLLSGFNGTSTLNELIPKVVSLLAPAYLIRFCVQNYRANKHMATMNLQKAIAARSLLAYTRNLSTSEENLKSQNNAIIGDIQKNVASIIFDPGETGFITTKEGAGSSDSFFHGTPVDRSTIK